MKNLLSYFSLLLLLLISCKQKEDTAPSESTIESKVETNHTEEQYIENEALLSELDYSLLELTKNPKFTLEKEAVENKHVDNVVDTIKIFKFKETSIQSYKAVSKEWIFEAKILDADVELLKFLKIGIDKSKLEKILNTKLHSDVIKVGNLEQTSVFVFKLKNDILTEIDYEGYVD